MVRKDRVSRTFIYHLLRIARELIKFLIWYDSVAWRTSQVPFGYIRLKRNEKYLLFYWLPDSDTYCIPQHSTISKLRQIPQYVSVISFWWRKIAFNSLVDVSSYWILSFSLALYSFPCIHLYMCCIFLVSFLPRRFFYIISEYVKWSKASKKIPNGVVCRRATTFVTKKLRPLTDSNLSRWIY